MDPTRRKKIPEDAPYEDLLIPVFRQGRRAWTPPSLATSRRRTLEQLSRFHAGVKRFVNPHQYPVGLELGLHELKTRLTLEARSRRGGDR